MNFTSLRAVIRNIKSHVNCPQCDNSYSNDDINVISAVGEKCMIVAQCDYCKTSILITANLSPNSPEAATTTSINTTVQPMDTKEIVSSDDVMDVHQFLKDFKGNFDEILPNK